MNRRQELEEIIDKAKKELSEIEAAEIEALNKCRVGKYFLCRDDFHDIDIAIHVIKVTGSEIHYEIASEQGAIFVGNGILGNCDKEITEAEYNQYID